MSRALMFGGIFLALALMWLAGSFGSILLASGLQGLVLLGFLYILAKERRSSPTQPIDEPEQAPGKSPSLDHSVEAVLSNRLVAERSSAAILEDFVHCGPDDFEENMGRALSRLGSYIGADRCYLYRFGESDQIGRRLLTWQVPNDREIPLPSADLSPETTARLNEAFAQDPVVLADDTTAGDYVFLELAPWSQSAGSINSFGAVAILQRGEIKGFLGFDAEAKNEFGSSEKNLLQLMANLFSTMFSRLDAQQCQLDAMEALEATSQAKSDFLATMSHEIRTPLNGVAGLADLLKETSLTDQQAEYVGMIHESGSLLISLVNDVLDLSKVEAGHLSLDPVETDLRALVENQVGLTAHSSLAVGLEIVCRMAPDLPSLVMLDPGRLRQILTNLLNNASKFTQEGHVYLNIEPGQKNGNILDLHFQVIDTGIGITDEQSERLFEKFTQAELSTTRRFGGTGLGLSICRHLVEMMGGKIWATGVLNEGSTFSFVIPVETLMPAKPRTPRNSARRVLLSTGHKLGGTVLAEMIQNLGYECRLTHDLEETLNLLSETPGETPGETDDLFTDVFLDPKTFDEDVTPVIDRIDVMPVDRQPRLVLLYPQSATVSDHDPLANHAAQELAKPVRIDRLSALLAMNPESEYPDENTQVDENCPLDHQEDDSTAGLRVLLAEDNVFNQKIAGCLLRRLGCQVTIASDGKQAREKVPGGEFDLIFMDCQMPEMDGYEVTRQIRRIDGPVSKIPIIALTANAFQEDREACAESGMDDFLTKPVNKKQLGQMLAKWKPHAALNA